MPENTSKIILASSSIYRQELLSRLKIDFETAVPDIDESQKEGETPTQLVKRLSLEKAKAIHANYPDSIIIGSDQVAAFENKILGKPGSFENAVEQLKMISGKSVTFHTGLTIIDGSSNVVQTDEVQIRVDFKQLDEQTIKRYLEKEPAFNCAGSFKSEGLGIALTERIDEQDPTALIGLPLIKLTRMLEFIKFRVI